MSTVSTQSADAILRRAHSQLIQCKARATPMAVPILIAVACLLGILGACYSEYYSAGIAFKSAFPEMPNDKGLGHELQTLRAPLIFCLLIGSAFLQVVPGRAKTLLDWMTHGVGLSTILLLLFGVGSFMAATIFLTLGGGDEQGMASKTVGIALAVASSVMFALSFVASHGFMGRLFGVIPTISTGIGERLRIKAGERLIRDVEARGADVDSRRVVIAEMEKPDALVRKSAKEAGTITGKYIAATHDLVGSLKAIGDAEIGPNDIRDVPNVPLAGVEARHADLAPYTYQYFYDLILKFTKG